MQCRDLISNFSKRCSDIEKEVFQNPPLDCSTDAVGRQLEFIDSEENAPTRDNHADKEGKLVKCYRCSLHVEFSNQKPLPLVWHQSFENLYIKAELLFKLKFQKTAHRNEVSKFLDQIVAILKQNVCNMFLI